MRMKDNNGKYHRILHRIFYFTRCSKPGICYSLCIYNLTPKKEKVAYLVNTLTGEQKRLDVEHNSILTEREKIILKMILEGKSSMTISERLSISKHTADRLRTNYPEQHADRHHHTDCPRLRHESRRHESVALQVAHSAQGGRTMDSLHPLLEQGVHAKFLVLLREREWRGASKASHSMDAAGETFPVRGTEESRGTAFD